MAATTATNNKDDSEDHGCLWVEIVSCRDLLVGDTATKSSDPYVKVKRDGTNIHETKHVLKTLNPKFGPKDDNAFLLETQSIYDFTVEFKIKDWDRFGSNDTLGSAMIPLSKLLEAAASSTAAVVEYPVMKHSKTDAAGYITLQCRRPTVEELEQQQQHSTTKRKWTQKLATNPATQLLKEKSQQMKTKTQQTLHQIKEKTTPQRKTKMSPVFQKEGDVEASSTALLVTKDTSNNAPKTGKDESSVSVTKSPDPPANNDSTGPLRIEIMGCQNLLSADKTGSSDPYVKVKYLGKDIHETMHIVQDLNPTYGPETKSTFVFHPSQEDISNNETHILFKVKDWDRIGSNDALGQVEIPLAKLYALSNNNNNDTHGTFAIIPPKGRETEDAGSLMLRCRVATDEETVRSRGGGSMFPSLMQKLVVHHPKEATTPEEETCSLFVEIVSCRDLLPADKTGLSDPYVKVKYSGKDVHETKHRLQTLNPAYSAEMNSSFVLDTTTKALQKSGGIVFKIKDWDRIGQNDELGQVTVSSKALLKGTGENVELAIQPPTTHKGEEAGFITFRSRPATDEDRQPKKGFFDRLGLKSDTKAVEGNCDTSLLIEIVSCWGLPVADAKSTDAYVKVKLGGRDVHETKPIFNSLDPIYTVDTNSLFILDANRADLIKTGGLLFKVKDYDTGGKNDDVCSKTIPAEALLESTGERLEFPLEPAAWVKGDDAGNIAVRCRPATSSDREFMTHLRDSQGGGMFSSKKIADFKNIDQGFQQLMKTAGGASQVKSMIRKLKKKESGVVKYRVRPFPDPARASDTEWMSKDDIQAEAMRGSREWIDAGSGNLGRVFVEVLGADGLPNKDASLGGSKNKTDAFVSLVYEDCAVKTDIIDDSLSPRWLPWMQRAFILRMTHSSSNLHVGVFDHDSGGKHDVCGRISIDLSNLRPDTEYFLNYNLYETSMVEDRQPKGTITLRLRMEIQSERSRIFSSLGVPPEFHINMPKSKDFNLVRQTIGGRHDLKKYSKKTIKLYVDELVSHQYVRFIINDAIISLLFWRGQVRLCKNIWVPFYSLVLFLSMVSMAEYPWLFPSFFCFGFAWVLLSVQNYRNSSPNPWNQTKSYGSLLLTSIVGSPLVGPHSIEVHQNESKSLEYESAINERIQEAKDDEKLLQEEQQKLMEEYEEMVADLGEQTADTDMATQTGGLSIDPFKSVLYPIQQVLEKACVAVRFAKNLLLWDEPYYAFFLTNSFITLGFVFLVTPWGFILKWTGRIIAWGVFGPHMVLVDICWYRKIDQSHAARKLRLKETYKAQLELARGTAATAREEREKAIKLHAIRKLLYGKYVTNIPVLRLERFTDIPLHSSQAKPFSKEDNPRALLPKHVVRVHGQKLELGDDMIPKFAGEEAEGVDDADVENQSSSNNPPKSNGEAGEQTPLIADKSPVKKGGIFSGIFTAKEGQKGHQE